MKKLTFLILILSVTLAKVNAQTLKDSVEVMYKNYFELLKTKEKVDSLSGLIIGIENRYEEFNTVLESNNEQIKNLTDAELFTLQTRLSTRRAQIINTADFIETANVSLNAIKLLDAVTDYLNDISVLNSPDNDELGFSLNTEITNILNEKIIKGKKINGGKADKFLSVVDNIIQSPITEAISSAVPVVSSIKSVVDLVIGTATRGKDVTVNDIVEFKTALKDYLEHYEGLAKAQTDFSQKLNSVDVRKEALILLLRQYTTERTLTLMPNITKSQLNSLTITEITTKYYSKEDVQKEVDLIINKNPTNFDLLLRDNKLVYPEYGISQAKFIRDEIDALGKEYIAAYESYQTSITEVLGKSKKIGKSDLVDVKIETLNNKLKEVENSFVDALNVENLNKKFKALPNY